MYKSIRQEEKSGDKKPNSYKKQAANPQGLQPVMIEMKGQLLFGKGGVVDEDVFTRRVARLLGIHNH